MKFALKEPKSIFKVQHKEGKEKGKNLRDLNKKQKRVEKAIEVKQGIDCPACMKTLKTEQSLKIHKQLHENVLKYKCSKCEQFFKQNSAKLIHEKKCTWNNLEE